MVALMSEMMEILPGQRILEIGTGSGYQTAILSELGAEVFTIELPPPTFGKKLNASLQSWATTKCISGWEMAMKAGPGRLLLTG